MVGQVGGERELVSRSGFSRIEICGLELFQAVFHRLANAWIELNLRARPSYGELTLWNLVIT